jgi:anhydro-N-acetylmuramic acid kinase
MPRPLAVLNIGGVANVTWIGEAAQALLAFDTGPGNALIDDWTRRATGRPYDADGALARAGRVDEGALGALLEAPYFARRPPKSLDRNDFGLDPVARLTGADGAATLAAFSAGAVARAVGHMPAPPKRWIVTGGGRRNPTLMAALRDVLGTEVVAAEVVGWDGDALEAQAFAYLAVRSLKRLPLSFPGTTGVPAPQVGGVLHRPNSISSASRATPGSTTPPRPSRHNRNADP